MVRMAELHLHYALIRPVVDEMRGERVAQHVRRQPLARYRARAIAAYQMPERLPRHAGAARSDEKRVGLASAFERGPRLVQVTLDPVHRFFAERHEPLLRAFAEH